MTTMNSIFANQCFVKATREEALDLFRGWQSEGSLLICNFGFSRFVAAFRTRVREVDGSDVQLYSDDAKSGLAVRLGADLEFGYGELPGSPDDFGRSDRGLAVFFPKAGAQGEPEVLTFTEVPSRIAQAETVAHGESKRGSIS